MSLVMSGGAGDQRWVIRLNGGEACPSVGYYIEVVEEAKGCAVARCISEQRVVVGSEIRVARRRCSNGINRDADRAAPPICYARREGRGEATTQAVPGDQDRRPFGGCGQECLKAFCSVLHRQDLPETDGGTEGYLRGLAGARDELII